MRSPCLVNAIGQARAELGLVISQPISDGRLHRCPVEGGRSGSLDGAYKINLDQPANVWAMNYRTGAKAVFPFGGSSRDWSPAERREFAAKVEEERKAREADQRKAWAEASQKGERLYNYAASCSGHPYLTAKGVQPFHALRVSSRDLIVPLYDSYGIMRSLQFISPDGHKRFLKGGRKSGCYLTLNTEATNRSQAVLICEGLATGLSLFQSTSLETLVTFDAGNLKAVALGARRDWPKRLIIMAADNDAEGAGNIGVAKAKEAAMAVDGLLSVPFPRGGNRGRSFDFNELHQAEGAEAVRAFIASAYEVKGGRP
jgi:putative DNA primase/helicase